MQVSDLILYLQLKRVVIFLGNVVNYNVFNLYLIILLDIISEYIIHVTLKKPPGSLNLNISMIKSCLFFYSSLIARNQF